MLNPLHRIEAVCLFCCAWTTLIVETDITKTEKTYACKKGKQNTTQKCIRMLVNDLQGNTKKKKQNWKEKTFIDFGTNFRYLYPLK